MSPLRIISVAVCATLAACGVTKTTKTEVTDQGVKITVAGADGKEQVLEADVCLVAIGVAPVLPGGALFAWRGPIVPASTFTSEASPRRPSASIGSTATEPPK